MKRGATSQLARKAASALSNVSVCPQQRQVYVGMISGGTVSVQSWSCAVAPTSILRDRLGGSRLRSLTLAASAALTHPARSLWSATTGATAEYCRAAPRQYSQIEVRPDGND